MHPDRLDTLTRRLGDARSRRDILSLLGSGVVGTAVAVVGLNETLAKSNHNNKSKRGKGNNGGDNKNGPKNKGPFERLTNIPISSHDQQGHNFQGVLNITGFAKSDADPTKVVALGTVSGKVTGQGIGNQSVTQDVTLPVSATGSESSIRSQATCQVLNLVLGPIDLSLLGLVLHVNQINIRLTANTAGGILGQLLCSLAGPISGLNVDDLLNLLTNILNALLGV
jgi:hypothetical protein